MKAHALALALTLSPAVTGAYPPEQCQTLNNLIERAMNYRVSGMPIQRALEQDKNAHLVIQKMWDKIVPQVYTLPTAQLAGPRRADILSQVYVQCLAEGSN